MGEPKKKNVLSAESGRVIFEIVRGVGDQYENLDRMISTKRNSFVVSLSNHIQPFDRLRASGGNEEYMPWLLSKYLRHAFFICLLRRVKHERLFQAKKTQHKNKSRKRQSMGMKEWREVQQSSYRWNHIGDDKPNGEPLQPCERDMDCQRGKIIQHVPGMLFKQPENHPGIAQQ